MKTSKEGIGSSIEFDGRYSDIFHSLPAHIALIDSTGMIITVNEAWKQFARDNGLKGDNYTIGDNYLDICASATAEDKETASEMAAKLKQVLSGELMNFSLEYPCHGPDEKRWFRVEVRSQDKGKVAGAVLMHINITEIKLAEEAIKRALHETGDYKFALDESSIVAMTDHNGIILHANGNFCKIAKYSCDELIGQDHRIISSGYHSKEYIRMLWTTISKGKIWKGEMKNKAKDGTIYWVDTTIVPFLNERGRPYKYLAIRSDITARKLAEERVLGMNAELEGKIRARTLELTASMEREQALNSMKSRFVSMASHEFRTPLSTIMSSVSLITSYEKEDQLEKRQKHIDRIKSSVRNLTEILNDFLSIEKLEQGKVELVNEVFNLHEFCSDIIEDVSGMLRSGQRINLSYIGFKEIEQDKKILKNVLLNLLSNAIKYSPENKEIYLSVEIVDKKVCIGVKDNGIGIPEEDQENIFGQFFRAKNTDTIQGTGLGLNIVKRYAELMGGTISFISKPGEGSTFTVCFPQNQ